jgi:hypothetical protein
VGGAQARNHMGGESSRGLLTPAWAPTSSGQASGGPGGACGPKRWGDGRAGFGPDPPGPPDASVNWESESWWWLQGHSLGPRRAAAWLDAAKAVKEGIGVKVEGGTRVASRGPTWRSATPPV